MTSISCHPERSLPKSEAICRTKSKALYCSVTAGGDARNFHVLVRFFDDHESEQLPRSSREAAACNSAVRKGRVSTVDAASPKGTKDSRAPAYD
jgi:hypothetical protein